MVHGVQGMVLAAVAAGAIGGMAVSFITSTPGVARQPDQTTFQVVRTHEMQLIDTQGRTRATMGFSADAQPYIQLRDERDAGGVWIGVGRETGLAVRDVDGKTRLVLSIDESGRPSLIVRNRQQEMRSFP